jgi:hypothetical protein
MEPIAELHIGLGYIRIEQLCFDCFKFNRENQTLIRPGGEP